MWREFLWMGGGVKAFTPLPTTLFPSFPLISDIQAEPLATKESCHVTITVNVRANGIADWERIQGNIKEMRGSNSLREGWRLSIHRASFRVLTVASLFS
jgi:hypothetical protein